MTRAALLGGTSTMIIGAVLGFSAAAIAQQAAADNDEVEEVVVTGSRIPRADLIANSPVSVIQAEEFELTSTMETESLLETLPQITPSSNSGTNNPGNGQANIDLRNLGTVRTLILVNSRRFVGAGTNGVVDINNIPSALIERVEVVTGGASAVYGSDAMAGVVNFILKDDFEGLAVNGQFGVTQEGDSERYNIDATMGTNFANGRGNVVIYGNYFRRKRTLAAERDFAKVALDDSTDANGNPISVPGGSSRIPQGRISGTGLRTSNSGLSDPAGNSIGGSGILFENNSFRAVTFPVDRFNFAPFNNLQLPLERYTMSAYGRYDVTDGIEFFSEMTFANNRIDRALAPTPFAESGFQLDLRNPFLPADARALLAGALDADGDNIVTINIFRRMLEAGSRISEDSRTLWRMVSGFRGELPNGWDWEVSYNVGRNENTNRQDGNVVISRFQQGLLVDPADPTKCANTTGGCVVLNPFGEGNFTQDMVDFVTIAASNITNVQQQVWSGTLTGTVMELPAGELGLSIGSEYRAESAKFQPDTFLATGDIDGFNAGLPTGGRFDVWEIFGETVVPIISGAEFAQYVGLEAGVRFSDYSTAGSVTSYKIGGEWLPVEGFKIRGLFQRAVRAPNILELFRGASNSFPGATDFCNFDSGRSQAEADFCVNQLGVPAGLIDTFKQEDSQVEVLLSGNPDLREETSDTWSVGFVYTPEETLPNLQINVDFYSIKIDNAIDVFGGGLQPTITACRAVLDINDPFCQKLTARRSDGQLAEVVLQNQNIAKLTSRGIDFQAKYTHDLPGNFGSIDGFLAGTRVIDLIQQGSPFVAPFQCAGFTGPRSTCDQTTPKWKFVARGTWRNGPAKVTLRWQFIGETKDDRISGGADPATLTHPFIGSESYFDATVAFDVNDNVNTFFTVKNLFDNNPPILSDGVAGQFNTDAATFDTIGRRFTFGFRSKF